MVKTFYRNRATDVHGIRGTLGDMKVLPLILVLAVVSGCSTGNPGKSSAFGGRTHDPSPAELGRCPFGHANLKDVPIIYGTLVPDPETERQFRNLEACYGGCVVSEESPRRKVVCPDCGYRFEADERLWSKSTDDRATFSRSLSGLVAGLPAPDGAVKRYDQSVTTDGRVVYEKVSYYCLSGATLDLASRINAHVQRTCRMALEGRASQDPSGTSMTLRGQCDDGRVIRSYIEYEHELGRVVVVFVVSRPEFEPKWNDHPPQ
jgi:hypothetical protein